MDYLAATQKRLRFPRTPTPICENGLAVVPRRPRQTFLDSVRAPACPGELVKNGSRLGVSKEIVRRVRKQVYAERGEDVRGRSGAGWGSL
ncbi:uncharacterized protein RSE6_03697 [Rhynchosporium secalis]|uniref:Uncharacterized protein n=1 Tax=Rhynchosporium secalis TaxID=38038 RepID=A0A1E1M4W9_RHYSE|nr:uncharacterized protein RSE6_03697 [Rhynchosporium secalis]